ncbi:NADH dehydrogenase [ubiquinone] 1 alpha subcomplex assembly factor 4-like [Babylonia areolata]|uniref:NADH dehydrogenase [ubiquinone] 1 alpha subcomplex assembly factor 4-like n=1 Tax=Babylonia areolata TaxID=304850 RepID=UPI003FD589D9
MGRVASKAARPVKNFNVENRARKLLDSDKPRPAPRHPSTAAALDSFAEEHPEFYEEQKKKNKKLDDFLKNVKVDSVGDNPEIRSLRSMPEDRRKNTPAEYGFPDPEQIPEGRASLRQMLEFISMHHLNPRQNSAEKIALDYKLDVTQVRSVLKYFQTLNLHIPKEMLKKNPKLLSSFDSTPAQRQTLKGMDDLVKLGEGDGSPVDGMAGPQKTN